MAQQFRVFLLSCALVSCTAHGGHEAVDVQTEAAPTPEPDRFAWLTEVEAPTLDHDAVLEFAATAIEFSPARPWQIHSAFEATSFAILGGSSLLYGDQPRVGFDHGGEHGAEVEDRRRLEFNAAHGLPPDAMPSLAANGEQLIWRVDGEIGGFERITRTPEGKPMRIDGFDAEGRWRRSALFQHQPRLTRRVEFEVVDRVPLRGRTLVFQDELLIAKLGPDRVEYRRWRTDRESQAVVFEHHPDRLIRTAQVYERGTPYERVDVLPPLI